jgi:rare lipoprotein A
VSALFWGATTDSALAKVTVTPGHTFTGYSHHYGDHLHGRRTSSGQPHNKFKLTAAHRSLPFGTHLHVTNTRNGKSCVVVVNDRGPFGSPSLVLDVSKAAAHALGFPGGGKIPIHAKVIDAKTGAEGIKNSEQIASVKNYIAKSNGDKSTIAPVATKDGESIKKIASVAVKESVPTNESAVPKVQTIAIKPATLAADAKSVASHTKIANLQKPSQTSPVQPEAKAPETTFLLVINDALENDKSVPALTAEYSTTARHASHYAPTVFIPMSEPAATAAPVKKPSTARSNQDGILM